VSEMQNNIFRLSFCAFLCSRDSKSLIPFFFVLVFGISQRIKIKIYQTKENKKVFCKKTVLLFLLFKQIQKICFCHFANGVFIEGTKLLSSKKCVLNHNFFHRLFYDDNLIKMVSLFKLLSF